MHNLIRYRNRPYIPKEAQLPKNENANENATLRSVSIAKTYHADSRLKSKDLLLNNAVRNEASLSIIANIESVKTWDDRLQALGMAVTIIDSMGEEGRAKTRAATICQDLPKRPSFKIFSDPVLNMRGLVFLQQFLHMETLYDATTWALGIRLGSDAKQSIFDTNFINGFSTFWSARLAITGR